MKRKNVEYTLKVMNGIYGAGDIAAVVWGERHAGVDNRCQGIAVRQFQYGMDAKKFLVMGDKVRFLKHTREIMTCPRMRTFGVQ